MEENKLTVNRTPELIAAEIIDIKNQTKKMLIYNSIEIGRRLCEAKELVPHGEWGNWLGEKVDYSKSTANNLMKVFKEYGADQMTLLDNNVKSQAFGNLSYTQAVELLKIPEEDREQFIEENNVEEMSTRELKKAIAELEQVKKAKEESDKTAQKALDDSLKLRNKLKKLEKESSEIYDELNAKRDEVLEARKETEELKSKVKELEEKPVEVVTGVDDEKVKELEEQHKKEIDKLTKQIEESQNKLHELESKEPLVIKEFDEEKIKELQDQHQKEVDDLKREIEISKNRVQDLEIKLNSKPDNNPQTTDESLVKFKVHFDGIVSDFKTLLGDIEEIDIENKEKYTGAVRGLLNKMLETL